MTGLWVVTGVALIAAVAAWIKARRASARLTQLSDMYWELKYQHLELKKQIERTSGTSNVASTPVGAEAHGAKAATHTESFVPLTSLRR